MDIVTITIVVVASIGLAIWNRQRQNKQWNNGLCRVCGGVMDYIGRALGGEHQYRCRHCIEYIVLENYKKPLPLAPRGTVIITDEQS